MESLEQEIAVFRQRKTLEASEARQRVALQLSCGIDLSDIAGADEATRKRVLARLERAIQRERMKAAVAHWSYDLNRHIALKQALDDVRRSLDGTSGPEVPAHHRPKNNGARRRRSEITVGTAPSGPCAYGQGPSFSPAASGQRRNSARPSDSLRPDPTSRDTAPASGCSASSGAA